MNCKECKASVYPTDPTVSPGSVNGRRLPPLCEDCSRYGSAEYIVEQLQEKASKPETICTVHGCPIWKTVAKLNSDLQEVRAELAHVRAKAAERKEHNSKPKEGYW